MKEGIHAFWLRCNTALCAVLCWILRKNTEGKSIPRSHPKIGRCVELLVV